ncbi:MAG: hypothetical protein KDB21_01165 [Acidimicrobiales bacterium]|nr:hypothetical protein [Acidimicrobiales bacterium]
MLSTWHGYPNRNTPTVDGLALRYLLVAELISTRRTMALPELVDALDHLGAELHGRASKVVSDALRWEVRRGRVVRVGRGRYVLGSMPRSTRSWICQHAELVRMNLRRLAVDGAGHARTEPRR